jgi:hypothetical protein
MDNEKRTCRGVAGGAVPDDLAVDAAFLSHDVQGDVVGVADMVQRSGGGVEGGIAERESDVSETEGVRLGAGAAFAILPGAEKEEGVGELGDGVLDVTEEPERDGPQAGG